MIEKKRKKKTYLGLETRLVSVSSPCSSSCCRHFDTLRWLGVVDWLMLKVGSLVVVVVADGCYGSGGGRINKVSDATWCYQVISDSACKQVFVISFSMSSSEALPSMLTTVVLDIQLKICSCLHISDILSLRKVCNRYR